MSEKMNNIMKHKRILFFGFILVGFIVLIFLIYILTYANNKPKPFKEDKGVKITNKCKHFKFNLVADTIQLKANGSSTPTIECRGKITSLGEKISNVTLSLEVHTNWTTKTDVSGGNNVSFNNGNKLNPGQNEYYSDTSKIKLGVNYPVRTLPLVTISKPTIYAKITYTRTTPESSAGGGEEVTETVYYKFSYSQYYVDGVTTLK